MVTLKKKKKADKISDRNQAHQSVSSDAEYTCIMGASPGTSNKYFSRTLMLTDMLCNNGLSNYRIAYGRGAAQFSVLPPKNWHVDGEKHAQTQRCGSQAEFQK